MTGRRVADCAVRRVAQRTELTQPSDDADWVRRVAQRRQAVMTGRRVADCAVRCVAQRTELTQPSYVADCAVRRVAQTTELTRPSYDADARAIGALS